MLTLFIVVLKRKLKRNTTESLSLFSSMYKANDVSNVHVKSLYHRYMYKVLKSLMVQSNVHLPTLSSSGKNK